MFHTSNRELSCLRTSQPRTLHACSTIITSLHALWAVQFRGQIASTEPSVTPVTHTGVTQCHSRPQNGHASLFASHTLALPLCSTTIMNQYYSTVPTMRCSRCRVMPTSNGLLPNPTTLFTSATGPVTAISISHAGIATCHSAHSAAELLYVQSG